MPDSIAYNPVQPFDLSKGLSAVNEYLGAQRQQQALQTGQYQQQSAQATASQDKQKNAELTAVGNLTKNADKYRREDGSFDSNRFADDVNTVAPVYGPLIANQATSRANEIVVNKQAIQNLTTSKRAVIGNIFQSLASDPQVNQTKVIDGIEEARQQYKDDPEMSRLLTSAAMHLPEDGDPKKLQAMLGSGAANFLGQTTATPSTIDSGPTIQPGTTNRYTGAFTPSGEPIKKGLAPTETPGYKRAVAGAGTQGSGMAAADIDRANEVSGAARNASNTIGLTQRIDDLAEQVHSGKFAQWVVNAANTAGIKDPSIVARQLLDKDLGQVKAAATSSAGTDAKMATVLSGYPDSTSQTGTIHGAMDYIRGQARQQVARSNNLDAYREAHPDLAGFQHADDVVSKTADPLMHEFNSLKTPAARTEFYKRNFTSKEEAAAFRDKVTAASHLNAFQ